MAFDAGELVATIRAAGLQALEAGLTSAETKFKAVGKAAEQQGAQTDAATKRAAAGATAQGAAAAKAGTQSQAAARGTAAATDAAAAAAGRQASSTRSAGTAAQDAGTKGKKAGDDTAAAAARAEAQWRKNKAAAEDVGRALTAVGVVGAAALAGAASSAASFDSRMAQLQSLGKYGQSSMDQAAQAALTAGKAYGLTANDVADAEIELQKAGVNVTQQLGGALPGALTLAAAGQMDVADATSIAVTAMTQFHLEADQTSHVADLLAAGSDKALGSVADLGMALKQGGLVAAQYGWSLDETVGTLSAFANAGLVGSDAGTSLKTALLQLATPTQQQAALLKEHNIQLYDAEGHFVSAAALAGNLQKSFHGVDDQTRNMAMGVLFGSDAVRAANVLFNEGQSGIEGWTKGVQDAGFAAQQAGGKQDSLAGDAQKVAAAFQNDLIVAGRSVMPILRGITQAAGGVLDVVGELPAPIAAGGVALTALGTAATLGTGTFLLMAPRIVETVRAVGTLRTLASATAAKDIPYLSASLRAGSTAMGTFRGAASSVVSALGGPLGLGLAAAGAGLVLYNMAVEKASASTDVLAAAASRGAKGTDALLQASAQGTNVSTAVSSAISDWSTFGATQDLVTKDLQKNLDEIGHNRSFGMLGDSLNLFEPQAKGTIETLAKAGDTLGTLAQTDAPKAAQAFQGLAGKTDGSRASLSLLLSLMPSYQSALEAQATASGRLTGHETDAQKAQILLNIATRDAKEAGDDQASTAQAQADAIAKIQGNSAAAQQDVKDLANAIKGLGSSQLDARAASRDMAQAVDDARKAAQKAGDASKSTTQADRDKQASLDKVASSAIALAAATYTQSGSISDAADSMTSSRKSFIDVATDMLGSRDAAVKLADKLHLIPGKVRVLVDVNSQDAMQAITDLSRNIRNVPRYFLVHPDVAAPTGPGSGIPFKKSAIGGPVTGGSPNRDSVPLMAMPGEHMVTTSEVQAVGGQAAMYRVRAAMRAGTLSGYARGGAIGDAQTVREKAASDAVKKQHQIDAEIRRVQAARRASNRADKAYQRAQDDQSKIYGKGTASAKHQATLDTRQAKKDADAAAAAQKAAEDRLQKYRDELKSLHDTVSTQASRGAELTTDVQDLGIGNSRGDYTSSSPFAATDLALQYSRDANLTKGQRSTLNSLANTSNDAILKLTATQKANDKAVQDQTQALQDATTAAADAATASDTAASSLQSLKDTAKSMADGIANTVRGLFSLGGTLKAEQSDVTSVSHNAGTAAQWDEKVTSVTPGGTTVASIRATVEQDAASMASFTGQLQALSRMGYSATILQDVANLGVDQGSQVAAALLQGSVDDVRAINAGYVGMATASGQAGQFVADQTYGGQINGLQGAANAAAQVAAAKAQAAADAQRQLDTLNANTTSINAQIDSAQQQIVRAVQTALGQTGAAPKKAADGLYREGGIAPAGSSILWAEQETGGESFIPHAPQKRARSLSILQATARRFGTMVVPMADGGIYVNGGGHTTDARRGGDHFDFSGGVWLGTQDQVLQAAERQARARKARAVAQAGLGRVNP